MVTLCRMQVTTSCRMRRPGSWKSTSLVTTVGTRSAAREVGQLVQAQLVVRPPAQASAPDRRGRRRPRAAGAAAARSPRRPRPERAPRSALRHRRRVGPVEIAFGLAAALLAERQQPAQPRIGRPVGRIDQDRHAVGEIEPAADDQADAGGLGGLMGAHDAGQRVAVDDGERLDAEDGGVREQLLAGRRAPQEARNARSPAVRRSAARSSEDPVQEPALRAGRGILAVAGAVDPVALAGIVLDPEIVAHRDQLGDRASTIRRTRARDRRRASPAGACRAR